MPDACRMNDHISRAHFKIAPFLAAIADACMSAGDTHYFMSSGVKMIEGIDAIAPGGFPFIVPEKDLKNGGGVRRVGKVDGTTVYDEWQSWIVGRLSITAQKDRMGLALAGSHRLRAANSGDPFHD